MDEPEIRNSLVALHSASFAWAVVCCRRDRELAEEVLQSVYASLLGGRMTFAGKSTFKTWLFAVIRNVARDHLRGRWWSRVVRLELEGLWRLPDNEIAAEDRLATDQEAATVRLALAALPRRQRELMHLVFYQDMSVAEAAGVMEISIGSASRHYARAKESLKRHLSNPKKNINNLNPVKIQTDARSV